MRLKVLVVDDDDVIVLLHNILVEENGLCADPLGFENGKDALDYLNEQSDDDLTHLILLDINMPVMNGWQLLEEIQELPYADRVFVIMVTSSVDIEDIEKSKRFPQVVDYLEKPLEDKSFRRIRRIPQLADYFS